MSGGTRAERARRGEAADAVPSLDYCLGGRRAVRALATKITIRYPTSDRNKMGIPKLSPQFTGKHFSIPHWEEVTAIPTSPRIDRTAPRSAMDAGMM